MCVCVVMRSSRLVVCSVCVCVSKIDSKQCVDPKIKVVCSVCRSKDQKLFVVCVSQSLVAEYASKFGNSRVEYVCSVGWGNGLFKSASAIYPPDAVGSKRWPSSIERARTYSDEFICMRIVKSRLTTTQTSSGPAQCFRTWSNQPYIALISLGTRLPCTYPVRSAVTRYPLCGYPVPNLGLPGACRAYPVPTLQFRAYPAPLHIPQSTYPAKTCMLHQLSFSGYLLPGSSRCTCNLAM